MCGIGRIRRPGPIEPRDYDAVPRSEGAGVGGGVGTGVGAGVGGSRETPRRKSWPRSTAGFGRGAITMVCAPITESLKPGSKPAATPKSMLPVPLGPFVEKPRGRQEMAVPQPWMGCCCAKVRSGANAIAPRIPDPTRPIRASRMSLITILIRPRFRPGLFRTLRTSRRRRGVSFSMLEGRPRRTAVAFPGESRSGYPVTPRKQEVRNTHASITEVVVLPSRRSSLVELILSRKGP
jgi:hypothetical protein